MKNTTIAVLLLALLLAGGCSGFVSVRTRPPSTEPSDPPATVEISHPAHLGIPPGHLPPPGQCRVWIPGRPPGHQPPAGSCNRLESQVPAGAWLVYRPTKDRKHVRLSVYDEELPGNVVSIALYDAKSGSFVRVEATY